ncbi:MAG: sulfotransferase [Ilumatobacter sp.]|uniref:sulfotransferase n=1 Tax=Ilumatobacter sp. TaxID=1967498 RepID=UPI002627A367|nr:sulfotransferase [Ilumatobacter sp.]MDJ0769201.1 sulfotransferase [Ilumatobacter sp.]
MPAPDRFRPVDVLVAGAQKAGTTAVKSALAAHPRLDVHAQVEFPYFVSEHLREQPAAQVMERYFPHEPPPDSIRVAKSVGVMYSDDAVDFALGHNPGMRFVVLLRDPVGRAFSAFRYARRMGWEPETDFASALTASDDRLDDDPAVRRSCAYLRYSRLRDHVERIEQRVGADRLHVALYDDLRGDAEATLAAIVAFSGAAPAHLTLPRSNEAGAARNERLARLLRPRGRRSGAARVVQRVLPRRVTDLALERARRLNSRAAAPERPSAEAQRIVLDHCSTDVGWLGDRLHRDLSHWLVDA